MDKINNDKILGWKLKEVWKNDYKMPNVIFLVIYVEKWEYLVSTGNLKEREPVAGYVDSMKEWVNHRQKIKLKEVQKTKIWGPMIVDISSMLCR